MRIGKLTVAFDRDRTGGSFFWANAVVGWHPLYYDIWFRRKWRWDLREWGTGGTLYFGFFEVD